MNTRDIDGPELKYCRPNKEPLETGITIHENAIPDNIEHELERLYESVYCTLARLRIYDPPRGVSTYIARRQGAISAIFLFRREKDVVHVLNQQITVPREELIRFSRAIFSRYPARVISFYAIDAVLDDFPFVHQHYVALEEHILPLPSSAEQYMAQMSANFRSSLRRAEKKIKSAYPSFQLEVLSPSRVTDDVVREIISFTQARMAVKRKKAYIDQDEVGNLVRLIRSHGFVVAARIDGRMCGGSVWYRVGTRNFMHINAHDPQYDQFMLGNQVLLCGILHCIQSGGHECWLMGGFGTHKAKFRARPQYLESLLIYRSRLGMLVHCRRASLAATQGLKQRLRHRLRNKVDGDGIAGRFFGLCLAFGRAIKRLRAGAYSGKRERLQTHAAIDD